MQTLSREEIEALVGQCSPRAPTGVRNRALIAVLYRGGLRLSEALALRTKDIDQIAGTVTVADLRDAQKRVVGMDPAAFDLVQTWLERRRGTLRMGPKSPAFCTLDGRPLRDSYVRTLLARLARKAGIEKRVHAYALRHAHAAELAAEGTPASVIQQQLGHATLASTERYLRRVMPQERIKVVQARRWSPP